MKHVQKMDKLFGEALAIRRERLRLERLAQEPEVKALIGVSRQLREQVLSLAEYDTNPNLIHLIEHVLDDALAPWKECGDG